MYVPYGFVPGDFDLSNLQVGPGLGFWTSDKFLGR